MLNLCKGHVFVELNYPHIIGISGYERHHDMATLIRKNTGPNRPDSSEHVHQSCQMRR
jgi:hypothetical protein